MDYEVIDGDGHIIESRSDLEKYGEIRGAPALANDLLSKGTRANWSGSKPTIGEGLFDPVERLKDMDREGVDRVVCYPTVMLSASDWERAEDSAAAARAYNSWFAASYRGTDPYRFNFVAVLPMQDVDAAIQEAHRAVRDLGAVGVYFPPYSKDRHLDDPVYDPLYAKIEELGVPIGIHGGRPTAEPLARGAWFRTQLRFHAMVHPMQQMAAMSDIACGGVLERFPRLKVAFLEAGIGWMPSFIERLDGEVLNFPDDEPNITRKPSEYLLSGQCYFGCDPDEEMLQFAADHLGEDQIIYASDYPHFDCRFPDSVRLISERQGLPDRLKRKTLSDNARRLYQL